MVVNAFTGTPIIHARYGSTLLRPSIYGGSPECFMDCLKYSDGYACCATGD